MKTFSSETCLEMDDLTFLLHDRWKGKKGKLLDGRNVSVSKVLSLKKRTF